MASRTAWRCCSVTSTRAPPRPHVDDFQVQLEVPSRWLLASDHWQTVAGNTTRKAAGRGVAIVPLRRRLRKSLDLRVPDLIIPNQSFNHVSGSELITARTLQLEGFPARRQTPLMNADVPAAAVRNSANHTESQMQREGLGACDGSALYFETKHNGTEESLYNGLATARGPGGPLRGATWE